MIDWVRRISLHVLHVLKILYIIILWNLSFITLSISVESKIYWQKTKLWWYEFQFINIKLPGNIAGLQQMIMCIDSRKMSVSTELRPYYHAVTRSKSASSFKMLQVYCVCVCVCVIYVEGAHGVMVIIIDTATRVLILDETDCISHSINTLRKGMNPIILPSAMGK